MSDQKDKKLIQDMMEEMVKRWNKKSNYVVDPKDDTKWNLNPFYYIPKDAQISPIGAGHIQMSAIDYDGWTPWISYGDYGHPLPSVPEPALQPKCECGMTKTMGKEDQPSYHSDYCPIKKEIKK